jgi:hypothetical protein
VADFTPKEWQDGSEGGTPISAEALIDLETRTTDFATSEAELAVVQTMNSVSALATSQTDDLFELFPYTANVQDYGALGDGTANDTAFVQAAITAVNTAGGGSVYFPAGTYSCSDLTVPGSNITLYGDGVSSIITQRTGTAPLYLFKVNPGTEGTTDPDANDANIAFRDMKLLGTVAADGFASGQNVHLMSLSAVDNVTIERVTFEGFRADGIYLASSHSGATERHNRYIKIIDCVFDGVNQDNRNAISIIDGSDVLIQGCLFKDCTRTDMPGAIDMEPNAGNAFARIRGIRVIGNHFENCRGTAGAVGLYTTNTQASLTNKIRNIVVSGNTGNNVRCPFFFSQVQAPTDATVRNDIVVTGNSFTGSTLGNYPFYVNGCRGVKFADNHWYDFYDAGILGYTTSAPARDVVIRGNSFQHCGYTAGGASTIRVQKADYVWIEQNEFDDCGTVVNFSIGEEGTGTSTNIHFIANRSASGRVDAWSAKHASHTLSAATNREYHNDLEGFSVTAAHFGAGAP